jgi:hypothetical protein
MASPPPQPQEEQKDEEDLGTKPISKQLKDSIATEDKDKNDSIVKITQEKTIPIVVNPTTLTTKNDRGDDEFLSDSLKRPSSSTNTSVIIGESTSLPSDDTMISTQSSQPKKQRVD